jgi:hypothetical protein
MKSYQNPQSGFNYFGLLLLLWPPLLLWLMLLLPVWLMLLLPV